MQLGFSGVLGCHQQRQPAPQRSEARHRIVPAAASYGAGPARVLRDHEIEVLEVNRPDRAARRSRGRSDPTDAESAARVVLSGKATALPEWITGAGYGQCE